jgi:hypothetical protein
MTCAAPVLEVDTQGGRLTFVADPALARGPLDLEAWLRQMNASWESARVVLLKGAVYGGGQGAGRIASLHPSSYREELTKSFDDMPPFAITDVQAACESVDGFLTVEAAEQRKWPSA